METVEKLPTYDELPIKPGQPPASAWGLWGDDDEIGTINLLTPERVTEAAKLVHTGQVFALSWELELPNPPLFGREVLEHTIKKRGEFVNDDVYDNFNTQSSSQWDGLTHYGNTQHHGFYNGVTQEQITGQSGTRNGIQAWARRGIAGRGVLLDYRRWAQSQGIEYVAGSRHEISVSDLQAVAQEQGTKFQIGDILIVRSGWTEWYLGLDQSGRERAGQMPHAAAGMAQGQESLRWLWNNHFAAVVGDAISFEVFPPRRSADFMHQTILGLWGMPIGEMFYLEKLAAACAADGVYEFMFVAAPLNKLGGVASPPNALALK